MAAIPHEAGQAAPRSQYRSLSYKRLLLIAGLVVALCLSVAVDMALGPARYTLSQVLTALFDPASVGDQLRVVIWDIRMPVALMAVTVGACLSLAGAQMQTILANPLASPFTLGISAAAGFGAALALVTGVAIFPGAVYYMVPINAFIMAMLASLFIYGVSTLRGVTVETIVLLGIALVFTFNALLSLLQYLASEQALAAVVFWTMGSLTKATWSKVFVTGAVLVFCVPLFARNAWALTALRLGDDKAASFGVNVRRLRLETLMLVSLLRRHSRLLRRHHRLCRPGRTPYRAHAAWRRPALFPAGIDRLRRAAALYDIGRLENADPRRHPADWRHHRACRGSVLLLAHLHHPEAVMVALKLQNLSGRYGRHEVFSDVTTDLIRGGELTAVIGPNAAGKSTLFKRIAA